MRRETALKIMALLRQNLRQGLTIRQISKTLRIGYRPAYNHIIAMEKEGIITVEQVGKAKQSFLNLDNEKCRHLLKEVDMQRKEELFTRHTKLKHIIESLTAKLTETFIAELHTVILFGSYARGTQTRASDIDILFIVSDMTNKALREGIERECAGFQYSYNMRVTPIIADIHELKQMLASKDLTIGKEAREYGIMLYGSEKFWRIAA